MANPKFGLIFDGMDPGRARGDDPVEFVLTRVSFLDPPRAAAGRKLGERIRSTFGANVNVGVYAWCHVTYGPDDAMSKRGTRTLSHPLEDAGHLRDTATVREAWDTTRRFADAAGANTIVLKTPPEFSPGAASRRRLRAFAQAADTRLVWEPQGLWEAQVARSVAGELGVEVLVRGLSGTGRPVEDADGCWREIAGALRPATADLVAYAAEDDPAESAVLLFSGARALANLRLVARAAELAS